MFHRLLFTSKSSPLPDSACDKLERAGGYFLPCCSDSDNGGHTPAFMTGLQGSSLQNTTPNLMKPSKFNTEYRYSLQHTNTLCRNQLSNSVHNRMKQVFFFKSNKLYYKTYLIKNLNNKRCL